MKKLSLSDYQFKNLVSKICRDITVDNWKPDYIVGITRGGLIPAVMISHYFNIPCHTLNVSLRDNIDFCESNCWMSEHALGYNSETGSPDDSLKKKILIVDDINDTGNTINWIKNDWRSTCLTYNKEWDTIWGDSVRYAVIVDNLSSESTVPVSYHGMEINKSEEDIWINFPYEEWWKV